jgi:hypothetical protein
MDPSYDVLLTLAIPITLDEDVLDFLLQHPQWAGGFSIVDADGMGQGASLLSTMEKSGPYEWSVRAGASRRTEQSGDRFNEQELIVERPVRWFGKAGKDAAIGEKGSLLAQAAFEDAWHEAGHSLM